MNSVYAVHSINIDLLCVAFQVLFKALGARLGQLNPLFQAAYKLMGKIPIQTQTQIHDAI